MPKVYGITGSIASGKSTVTRYLRAKGYIVVDSDALAKEAKESDSILKKIYEYFPQAFSDGLLDNKLLGKIVFNDQAAKQRLESIIHPYVIDRLLEVKKEYAGRSFIFFDIPLLFESKLEYLVDEIIVVDVEPQKQLDRLLKRDNIEVSYAKRVIDNQLSRAYKLEHGDIIFDNNRTREHLYKQVDKFLKEVENADSKQ